MTVTPVMNDPLCAIWRRIEKDCGENPVSDRVNELLDCGFLAGGKEE